MGLKTVFLVLVLVATPIAAQAVHIDLVPVGNPGNAGELSGFAAGGFGPDAIVGGVNYNFKIGKFEITAGQYAEFLNAVARTDTYSLYSEYMSFYNESMYPWGCKIRRFGTSGSYT